MRKDGDDIERHQRHQAILQGLNPMLRLEVIGHQTDIERTATQTDQVSKNSKIAPEVPRWAG